jgi:hypothetical protein
MGFGGFPVKPARKRMAVARAGKPGGAHLGDDRAVSGG